MTKSCLGAVCVNPVEKDVVTMLASCSDGECVPEIRLA